MRSEFWQNIIEQTDSDESGNKLPFLSLAPMEAVTDVVFRHVVHTLLGQMYFILNSQMLAVLLALRAFIAHVDV